MVFVTQLERTAFKAVDCLSREQPEDTIVCIQIGGRYSSELKEALECLYVDSSREFKLIDIKEGPTLISALIVMEGKEKTPEKF